MKCLEVNDQLLAILSDSDEDSPPDPNKKTSSTIGTADDLLLSVTEDTKLSSMMQPGSSDQDDLAKMAAAADPFAGSNSLLTPLTSTGNDSKMPSKMPSPIRAPSGGLASSNQVTSCELRSDVANWKRRASSLPDDDALYICFCAMCMATCGIFTRSPS